MNKKLKMLLIIVLFLTVFIIPGVNAAEFNVCQKSGIMKTFQIVGYCLFIVKVLAPLILIVMGCTDFGKAVISSDENAIKSSLSILVKRAIAGVVIFFIPTIIWFVADLVDSADNAKNFSCLTDCMNKPDKCVMPKDGGVFGG